MVLLWPVHIRICIICRFLFVWSLHYPVNIQWQKSKKHDSHHYDSRLPRCGEPWTTRTQVWLLFYILNQFTESSVTTERGKLGDNERQRRDGVSETFPEIHITRCSQDSRMWQCVLSAWIMQRKKQDSGASRRSLTHKHMHTLFARQAPTPGTQRPAH